MALQIGQFYGTGGPRVEIVPSTSYGFYNETIGAGEDDLVKHVTNTPPVSDDWIISTRCWLSWQVHVGLAAGATLRIELTADDIAVYDNWNVYPLWGGATTWNAGIFIPAWKARLRIINNSGVAGNLIQGCFKIQAVF